MLRSRLRYLSSVLVHVLVLRWVDSAGIGGDGLPPGGLAATYHRTGEHAPHVSSIHHYNPRHLQVVSIHMKLTMGYG